MKVRARVVVLACGSLTTPRLLMKNGLANSSGEVGRNLSIHPASAVFGVFDESVDGSHAINQGYSIDHFKSEGIMFEGGSAPVEILASMHTGFGPSFIDLFERFDNICQFGFMVKDTSRGRVRERGDGEPLITYMINETDRAKIQRGAEILCRVLFAAGAREVHTPMPGFGRMRSVDDVDRLSRATVPARGFDLSAWHPLGTCRMGNDPLRSVVNARHETHEVRDLFITDGSSVPSSLGVNPQLTIMAMATRAAGFVSERLS